MTPNEYAMEIDRLTKELELVIASAFPQSAKNKQKRSICLSCEKPLAGSKEIRGNHPNCYRTLKRDIDSGLTSEGYAIAFGTLAPEQKSGRKIEATGARAAMLNSKKADTKKSIAAEVDQIDKGIKAKMQRQLAKEQAKKPSATNQKPRAN